MQYPGIQKEKAFWGKGGSQQRQIEQRGLGGLRKSTGFGKVFGDA
jgi:hypothetical protein